MLKLNLPVYVLSIATLLVQGCEIPSQTRQTSVLQEDAIEGIDVQSYRVSIVPDMEKGTVEGHQTTRFRQVDPLKNTLTFDVKGISILSAKLEGQSIDVTRLDNELIVPLSEATSSDKILELEIRYEANPERGYTSNDTVVFTEYFACEWMICRQNAFGDKSSMTLEITLPREMDTLGPGQIEESRKQPDGSYRVTWHQGKPYSPYLFAFAAGDFAVTEQQVGRTTFRFVSPIADEAELTRLFEPTADMLTFFESKAGVAMPQSVYSQLYVEGRHAQEAVSHSIIGSRYLEPILETPQEDWVIAHELAHQWWGNSITCKDLSHFWLNEGLTVFMVAAWKEERWGMGAYEQEISLAERRYEYAKTEGFDVPLSFDGEYPDRRVRAAIQYSKGALFFDELRRQLGDEAFWAGLKFYTKSNMGNTVVSRDLQTAFEQTSNRDLSELFDEWVY